MEIELTNIPKGSLRQWFVATSSTRDYFILLRAIHVTILFCGQVVWLFCFPVDELCDCFILWTSCVTVLFCVRVVWLFYSVYELCDCFILWTSCVTILFHRLKMDAYINQSWKPTVRETIVFYRLMQENKTFRRGEPDFTLYPTVILIFHSFTDAGTT